MIKRRIQLRNVQNVALSKTALIELPVGPRYHQVWLTHGFGGVGADTVAGAYANMLEIRIKVNGRVQRTMSGADLRALNILNGSSYDSASAERPTTVVAPAVAGGVNIPIFFAEPWRKSGADQDRLAWQSARWESFQIEVDLSTATTPTLVAHAVVDDFVSKPDVVPPLICKWIRQSVGASGTMFDISSLDRRDLLQQISIKEPTIANSKNIKSVVLRMDGMVLHEMTATANAALLINNGMTPVAARYDVVLDHDDLLSSAVLLDGSRDLTLTIEAGDAMSGTATVYLQRLGVPE